MDSCSGVEYSVFVDRLVEKIAESQDDIDVVELFSTWEGSIRRLFGVGDFHGSIPSISISSVGIQEFTMTQMHEMYPGVIENLCSFMVVT